MQLTRPRLLGAVLALTLVAGACGSGSADDASEAAGTGAAPAATETTDATSAPPDDSAAVPAANLFAPTEVIDLASGSPVNFADEVGGGSLPVLIWFWAPH